LHGKWNMQFNLLFVKSLFEHQPFYRGDSQQLIAESSYLTLRFHSSFSNSHAGSPRISPMIRITG